MSSTWATCVFTVVSLTCSLFAISALVRPAANSWRTSRSRSVLEVLGDRWTLLIVREALRGVSRFDEFQERLAVARNVLTDRLAGLEEEGMLERRHYQLHPPRLGYEATAKAHDVWPMLVAMIEWGDRYYAPQGPPRIVVHAACGGNVASSLVCRSCQTSVPTSEITTEAGRGSRRGSRRGHSPDGRR